METATLYMAMPFISIHIKKKFNDSFISVHIKILSSLVTKTEDSKQSKIENFFVEPFFFMPSE